MNKRERIDAAVAGRDVDRPPICGWRHFTDQESNAVDLAKAMVKWYRDYDWDFLKINPRATYVAEAFGNVYDLTQYASNWPLPKLLSHVIHSPSDLSKIKPIAPDAGPFGEQLDAVAQIVRQLDGECYAIQTIFSPLSYLVRLAAAGGRQVGAGGPAEKIREFEAADEAGLHAALDAIATTLAAYASEVLKAGADGLFYAVVQIARKGQLTREEHRRLGRPYDLKVLEAARGGRFNMLHLCGDHVYLEDFADYDVQSVSWDVLGKGNPSLAQGKELIKGAVAGGTGEAGIIQTGTPEEVTELVRQAIQSTGGRRLIVAPGCSFKPPQNEANIRAFRRAVEPA